MIGTDKRKDWEPLCGIGLKERIMRWWCLAIHCDCLLKLEDLSIEKKTVGSTLLRRKKEKHGCSLCNRVFVLRLDWETKNDNPKQYIVS